MSDNVVHLNFSKPDKTREESLVKTLTGCAICNNKTFTLMITGAEEFPLLVCAACQVVLSRVGYVPEGQ